MVMIDPDDEVLAQPEVAERIGVAPGTLRTWRAEGKGPRWFRLGKRRIGYLRSDVENWLADQYHGPPKPNLEDITRGLAIAATLVQQGGDVELLDEPLRDYRAYLLGANFHRPVENEAEALELYGHRRAAR